MLISLRLKCSRSPVGLTNDPPVFTPGPNIGVAEDSGLFANLGIQYRTCCKLCCATPSSLDEAGQVVDFTVTVDNPSLFSVQPTISSSNAAVPGLLQFTPNRDAFGSVVVTVRAVDRGPSGGIDQTRRLRQHLRSRSIQQMMLRSP